jgi:hypothetical protein
VFVQGFPRFIINLIQPLTIRLQPPPSLPCPVKSTTLLPEHPNPNNESQHTAQGPRRRRRRADRLLRLVRAAQHRCFVLFRTSTSTSLSTTGRLLVLVILQSHHPEGAAAAAKTSTRTQPFQREDTPHTLRAINYPGSPAGR